MPTADELPKTSAIDLACIDKEALVDIQAIQIDGSLPKEERILDFIRQIKNPYLFKCGDMIVQSIFSDTEVTLTDRLKQYLKTV